MATDKKGSGVGALYLADLGYPMLPKGATEDAKFDELQDYLYRLVESLRWTLEHLDESNFNSNFFLDIAVGELYEPTPILWTVTTRETEHYDVEDELGTEGGDVTTVLFVDDMDTRLHGHVVVPDNPAAGDGDVDTTLAVIDDVRRGAE